MKTREIVAVTVALLALAMTAGAAPASAERGKAERDGRPGRPESIGDQDAAFMQMMRRYGEAYKRGDREAADKIARGMRRRIAANAKPQMERPERRPAKVESPGSKPGAQRSMALDRARPERPERREEIRERLADRGEMMRQNWERRRDALEERRKSMDEQRRPGRAGDADWAERRAAARDSFEDRREMMREMRDRRRGECPLGNERRPGGADPRYARRGQAGMRGGFEGMDRSAQPSFRDRPGGRRPEMGPRGDRQQLRRPDTFQPRRQSTNEQPRRLMAD
jgi:hypothetical protein